MTLEEEIMKLDLIASDAFEGRGTNEFRQLAEQRMMSSATYLSHSTGGRE